MLKLSTSQKIFLASILSKFLVFFFGSEKKIIRRNGINYKVDLNEGVDLGIYLNVKLEGKISNLSKLLKKNKKLNLIDIGANIGSVSLPLAKLFDKSSIFSIEPTYYAFEKLLENVNLNPVLKKRIKTLNFLINKEKKTRKVYSSWNLNNQGLKHRIHLGSLKKINEKNIISLDQLIKSINKKIDFIKIDVEGNEMRVLYGMEKIIHNIKVLQIEFGGTWIDSRFFYRDLYDYLKKYNFDLYRMSPNKLIKINIYEEIDEYFSFTNFVAINNLEI